MKLSKLMLITFMLVITPALLMAGSHGFKAKTSMDVVDTAVSAGSFNTLAAALKAADLVDVLKGQGPFTVFAPTDEAFDKLPCGIGNIPTRMISNGNDNHGIDTGFIGLNSFRELLYELIL